MLAVDNIECIEASDYWDDDIYLVVFRGSTVAPFDSQLGSIGPGSPWSDISSGDHRTTDVDIAATSADSVYAVMMVDKDSSKDIDGSAVVGAWNMQTALTWKSIMLSHVVAGTPTNSSVAKNAGFAGIKNTLNGLASIYMEFPKGDDDVIDVKRVTISTVGQKEEIEFFSPSSEEDARYKVVFKHTSTS